METDLFDDWRSETQMGLKTSKLFKTLDTKCKHDTAGSHVLSLIDDAVFYAYQRTKTILMRMGEYTLHDGDHLFRVLRIMDKLIPDATLENLSVPEIMLLILTAFFHDIGMAPSTAEVEIWYSFWDDDLFKNEDDLTYKVFSKFTQGFPTLLSEIDEHTIAGNASKATLLKQHLISEFIRSTHAERARKVIEEDWKGKIVYRDIDLTNEFAQLCFSHNEDAAFLLELDTSLLCGPNIYACLPFVGVILRLADILDFDGKRTPKVLFSHLAVRNPVSLREWKKHRSVDAWTINQSSIIFHARCEHPAIEKAIRDFCDIIDRELAAANTILLRLHDSVRIPFPEYYKFSLPLRIDRSKIGPKTIVPSNAPLYKYQETKFSLNKTQVIDLLMGTKLYGNPEIALRELIQNSIDACLLRAAMAKSWDNPYVPKISVTFTPSGDDFLEVHDNGTGMDIDIINKYYSSVGTSYYKSSEFYELKSQINLDYTPISRFGIGILSCFMVADSFFVNTKRLKGPYESGEALEIIVEGQDSLFWIRAGELNEPGTKTKLLLRKNHPWKSFTKDNFVAAVKRIIPHPPFPIEIYSSNDEVAKPTKLIHTGEQFKNMNIEDLKDYRWRNDENLKQVSFEFGENDFGIFGKALVGILQKDHMPVKEIKLNSKHIKIDGEDFELNRSIRYKTNEIEKTSKHIEINDDEDPYITDSVSKLAASKAIIALHGIEVPFEIFPDFWSARNQQVMLKWPLPMLLILDVSGKHDLNLNSARTEILLDEKWVQFEENLATLICKHLAESLPKGYWKSLKAVLNKDSTSGAFIQAIKKF